MSHFVFSADAHIVEPPSLYLDALPADLRKKWGPGASREGDMLYLKVGERVVHRTMTGKGSIARVTKGQTDLDARREDMATDGVDAELIFPTAGLLTFFIEDPEAEMLAMRAWNDWIVQHIGTRRDTFVPVALLPFRDLKNTCAEMERIAKLGHTTAMLPVAAPTNAQGERMPLYNNPVWDPVFALAEKLGIVFSMHTGTGLSSWIQERGPGAAIINYSLQMNDAATAIMYLVAGGVLDRHPKAQVAFIECGASWLAGVAERMDEVHRGHNAYVNPKLSRLPSQIVREQVQCTFQSDVGALGTRHVIGTKALMWANDYPHIEGTFPYSKALIARMFDGVDISEEDQAAILGGNAARLFRLPRPEFTKAV